MPSFPDLPTSTSESLAWVDPDGDVHPLSDNTLGAATLWGAQGRFMPPIVTKRDVVPGRPGARRRATRHDVRELDLPVLLRGATPQELREVVRAWLARLDPVRGDGRLRNTADDASVRELTCRYAGGLELVEQIGTLWGDRRGQRAVLTFEADDPYWYDASDTIVDAQTGEPATFFPLFPLRLSSSEVFADVTIDNTGDVAVWPIFTFQGPGSAPTARNLTTDRFFSLTNPTELTLDAGETVTIDTRPDRKTVLDQDGANLFSYLTEDSSLWQLARGSNAVRLEMTAATSASLVRIQYKRAFLAP